MQLSKNFLSIAVLLFLGACSSAPKQTAQVDERTEYADMVRQDLQNWEKKEARLDSSRAKDLKAMIADTRAELSRMEAAANYEWKSYKPKVEDRLARIENGFKSAK